jgi:hypothetical protein
MTAARLFIILFGLATIANTGGMILSRPWVITALVDGTAPAFPTADVLFVIGALLYIGASRAFATWRGWAWQPAPSGKNVVQLSGALVFALLLVIISLCIGRVLGQVLGQ